MTVKKSTKQGSYSFDASAYVVSSGVVYRWLQRREPGRNIDIAFESIERLLSLATCERGDQIFLSSKPEERRSARAVLCAVVKVEGEAHSLEDKIEWIKSYLETLQILIMNRLAPLK